MRMTWATQPAASEIVGIVLRAVTSRHWRSWSQWPWHLWKTVHTFENPPASLPRPSSRFPSCTTERFFFFLIKPWIAPFCVPTCVKCNQREDNATQSTFKQIQWIEINLSEKLVGGYSGFVSSSYPPPSGLCLCCLVVNTHRRIFTVFLLHVFLFSASAPRLLTALAWEAQLFSPILL